MATVSYKIGGKFDGRQINNQKSGLSSLAKTGQTLKNAFKGLAVLFSIKKVFDFQKQSTQAYAIQEKALKSLSQQATNNQNITQKSLKSIISYTGKLQSKSIFGDEALQEQQAFLMGLGKSETEIKKVLKAQTELSSQGIGSLESNVKNLTKSLNGQKSELNRIIPEMASLTEEQLRNGEAVDLISKKYDGFAEKLATTTLQGQTQQASNLFGDIKEKIGSITGQLKFQGLKKIIPILENINNWLEKNVNKIINVFLNLPEVAKIVFTCIKEMIKKIFTIDGLICYVKSAQGIIISTFTGVIKVLNSITQAIGQIIWQPLKTGFLYIIFGIKTAFVSMVNFLIKGINKIIEAVPDWQRDKVGMGTINLVTSPSKPLPIDTKKITSSIQNIGDTFLEGLSDIKNQVVDNYDDMKTLYKEPFDKMKKSLDPILNKKTQDTESGNSNSNSNVNNNITENNNSNTTDADASKNQNGLEAILSQLLGQFGELGNVISLIVSGNGIGLLVSFISKIVSQLQASSEGFNQFINIVTTLSEVIAEVLLPVIDQIFTPFAEIIQILGELIGGILAPVFQIFQDILRPIFGLILLIVKIFQPFLQLFQSLFIILRVLNPILLVLNPALKFFAMVLKFLYNYILVPVVNFLLRIVACIGNFFIRMYNTITGILNKISIFGWHPFNFKRKKLIDYDAMKLRKIEDEPSASSSTAQSSVGVSTDVSVSKGQSYTAQKDVIVNIYYNNSYVNGDAREIALNIREEIKSAEKLGY